MRANNYIKKNLNITTLSFFSRGSQQESFAIKTVSFKYNSKKMKDRVTIAFIFDSIEPTIPENSSLLYRID